MIVKRLFQIGICIGLLGLTKIGLSTRDFTIEVPADPSDAGKWYWVLANVTMVLGLMAILSRRFGYQGSLVCAGTIFVFSYIMRIIPQFVQDRKSVV